VWQGAKTQEYSLYFKFSQRRHTGCIGVQNWKLFLREPFRYSRRVRLMKWLDAASVNILYAVLASVTLCARLRHKLSSACKWYEEVEALIGRLDLQPRPSA
jgi:hypothetical protein